MLNDIEKVLITEEQIQEKTKSLAKKINQDYKGQDLLIVGILKGSVIFASELMKNITIPCSIDFMSVSSYGSSTKSSGIVRIIKDLDNNIQGKSILIVEDIVDTGLTLSYLLKYLQGRGAKSIDIISLLNKPSRRKADINVKYMGFEVPDKFIVGYGIDYAEKYRNLPFIGTLKSSVYEK